MFINQLDVYHVVQPIMNLKENRVHGYEALIRSRKRHSPDVLFQSAKEDNRLFDLDIGSIFKACKTWSRSATFLDKPNLYLNVFQSTLVDPDFNRKLHSLLRQVDIKPSSIVLEINEHEDAVDLGKLKQVIRDLKSQGFKIALDDIGQGVSTIRAIVEIEPDIAKIDRFFAKDLATSPKKKKLVSLMQQFFTEEGMMILEGLENEADLQAAKDLGVSYAQGFHLGRPEPVAHYLAGAKA
ncbi:EAL domain-containing protein [Lentibacillus sediminis]|uniref:EAL domain-containing protein n=1 Tax=Lentibacillus sediminis TaxID=1940529 RepID=UPI000C1C31E2|nr:EAL domain-containing protein [Lentibacillus sediminis]